MRNYEGGPNREGEKEQLFIEVDDLKAEHLNLPDHQKLVNKAIAKIKKIDDIDAAREALSELDKMVVGADAEEAEIVKALEKFLGSAGEEDAEDAEEGYGDDDEFGKAA